MNEVASEFVRTSRNFYGQYHQHKELMAYGVTILYLTAASWITFSDKKPLASGPTFLPQLLLLIVLGVSACAFITWQLKNRRFAAVFVEACTRLMTDSVNEQSEQQVLTDSREYHGLLLPHFVVDELVFVAESRKWFRGPIVSEMLTAISILSATAVTIWRLAI
jgi:hypothetical protein